MNQTCIRVLADPVQIKECKESIATIETDIGEASRIFSLAGNEVRLKMLFLLFKEKQMCPCDLSDVLGMTVPAVSQHLRKLKDANMVIDKKIGQTIFYSLREEQVQLIIPVLTLFLERIKNILK